jgi:MFS family permease
MEVAKDLLLPYSHSVCDKPEDFVIMAMAGRPRLKSPEKNSRMRKRLGLVILVLVSAAAPFALVAGLGIDWNRLTEWNTNLQYLALVIVPFGLAQLLRGIRYKLLEQEAHPLPELIALASIQGALNQILPARAGELAYPILMKRIRRTKLMGSAGVMIISKLMDLFSAGFWLAVAASLIPAVRETSWGSLLILIASSATLLTLIGIFVAPALGRKLVELLRFGRSKGDDDQVTADKPVPHKRVSFSKTLLLLGISLGLWAALFSMTKLLLLWCGEDPSWLASAVASAGVVATTFIPVNTLLGIGVAEAGWVAGLFLIGIDSSVGTALAFRLHAGILGVNLLYGLLGVIFFWLFHKRRSPNIV